MLLHCCAVVQMLVGLLLTVVCILVVTYEEGVFSVCGMGCGELIV